MDKANKEILIIDDSVTNVFLIESVLNEYGYKAASALNAREAYRKMEKRLPDLILLDLLMPQISGFDFIKAVKAEEKTRNVPIIVVSAVTDEDSINEIMALGAVEFIKKPVVLSQLIEKIESILIEA